MLPLLNHPYTEASSISGAYHVCLMSLCLSYHTTHVCLPECLTHIFNISSGSGFLFLHNLLLVFPLSINGISLHSTAQTENVEDTFMFSLTLKLNSTLQKIPVSNFPKAPDLTALLQVPFFFFSLASPQSMRGLSSPTRLEPMSPQWNHRILTTEKTRACTVGVQVQSPQSQNWDPTCCALWPKGKEKK